MDPGDEMKMTPVDVLTAYVYLARSDLFFVDQGQCRRPGDLRGYGGRGRDLPRPLARGRPSPARGHDRRLSGLPSAARPKQPASPEMTKALDDDEETCSSEGIVTRIDVDSGMILQYGTVQRQTRITDFRWRDRIDPADFAIDGRSWDDFTRRPDGRRPRRPGDDRAFRDVAARE